MKKTKEYEELIRDNNKYSSLGSECEKVFDTKLRLPDFVFRPLYKHFRVIEHALIYSTEFVTFLVTASELFEDSSVNYMTIEPHPVDYYHKHCGFFGVASFKPVELAEKFQHVMYRDGEVDSFGARGGDVGVFWGSSLKWGIFCDRMSWELAVIASDADISGICEVPKIDASQISGYIKCMYHWNLPVAEKFIPKFIGNYF